MVTYQLSFGSMTPFPLFSSSLSSNGLHRDTIRSLWRFFTVRWFSCFFSLLDFYVCLFGLNVSSHPRSPNDGDITSWNTIMTKASRQSSCFQFGYRKAGTGSSQNCLQGKRTGGESLRWSWIREPFLYISILKNNIQAYSLFKLFNSRIFHDLKGTSVVLAKTWKRSICPSLGEWINCGPSGQWYIIHS